MKWWQRNVDKTIRCKCKVLDLLIKLIDWSYCASRIRRRSRRAVVSSTSSQFLVAFYVLRTPVYIWNRIARYTHFILFWSPLQISEGSFFDHEPQISVSSTTPKWKIQPNIQNTVDGKEDFRRDIISPRGVNKTDKTQASSEFAHESPLFYECFFLAVGGHCTVSTQGRVHQHVRQSKRVGIIAIKNKRTRIHF